MISNTSKNRFLYAVATTIALTVYSLATANTRSLDRTIAQGINNQPKIEVEERYQTTLFNKNQLIKEFKAYERREDFPENPSFDRQLEEEIQASEEATFSLIR